MSTTPTTPSTPLGIKTLTDKINFIEKVVLDDYNTTSGFVSNVISDVKSAQYNKLIHDVVSFVSDFKNILPENIDAYNDIVLICSTAVNYIEKNISKFAQMKNTKVTSLFKLQTCIGLVKEITNKFDDNFLTNTINHLVSVQCNKHKSIFTLKKK